MRLSSRPVVHYFHDRTAESRAGLTALIRAVARASADGMAVEIETTLASAADAVVPSVSIDGNRVALLTSDAIYDAIARAHRRTVSRATDLPTAMLVGRARR